MAPLVNVSWGIIETIAFAGEGLEALAVGAEAGAEILNLGGEGIVGDDDLFVP